MTTFLYPENSNNEDRKHEALQFYEITQQQLNTLRLHWFLIGGITSAFVNFLCVWFFAY